MPEKEKIHYNITVHGRVQGVGFRHSASSMARYFGIRGFVKNERDGSVYIEAEGTREILDEFVKWCRKGPGMGHVESVSIQTGDLKNFPSFNVRF